MLDGVTDPSPAESRFRIVPRGELIGRSVQGIEGATRTFRQGDPAAALDVLVVGSIHGDETQGHRVVDRLRDRVSNERLERIQLWTVKTVNPDGARADERTNDHGVDLNRNFSHAFDPSLGGRERVRARQSSSAGCRHRSLTIRRVTRPTVGI